MQLAYGAQKTTCCRFKTDRVFVSEKPPCSPDNGGYAAREFWRRASEDEASRTTYDVWFKNASFYGSHRYYIKDRQSKK